MLPVRWMRASETASVRERPGGALGRHEVGVGDEVDDAAVHLLRETGARNPRSAGRPRRVRRAPCRWKAATAAAHRRRRVALHEQPVRARAARAADRAPPKTREATSLGDWPGRIRSRSTSGSRPKTLEDLIEHLPMLRRRAEDRLEAVRLLAQPPHDRRELDRLRAGSDHEQDALGPTAGRVHPGSLVRKGDRVRGAIRGRRAQSRRGARGRVPRIRRVRSPRASGSRSVPGVTGGGITVGVGGTTVGVGVGGRDDVDDAVHHRAARAAVDLAIEGVVAGRLERVGERDPVDWTPGIPDFGSGRRVARRGVRARLPGPRHRVAGRHRDGRRERRRWTGPTSIVWSAARPEPHERSAAPAT